MENACCMQVFFEFSALCLKQFKNVDNLKKLEFLWVPYFGIIESRTWILQELLSVEEVRDYDHLLNGQTNLLSMYLI